MVLGYTSSSSLFGAGTDLMGIVSNNVLLMLNTYTQEIVWRYMDYYIEDLEDGKDVERLYVIGIKKGKPSNLYYKILSYIQIGTKVPDRLILIHEHFGQFSLQHMCPTMLSGMFLPHHTTASLLALRSEQLNQHVFQA